MKDWSESRYSIPAMASYSRHFLTGLYASVTLLSMWTVQLGIGTVDVRGPDLRPRGFRKHRHVNENLAGTRLILSDAALAELSQARRTYRLNQQETD